MSGDVDKAFAGPAVATQFAPKRSNPRSASVPVDFSYGVRPLRKASRQVSTPRLCVVVFFGQPARPPGTALPQDLPSAEYCSPRKFAIMSL